jgi:hypothetical protein
MYIFVRGSKSLIPFQFGEPVQLAVQEPGEPPSHRYIPGVQACQPRLLLRLPTHRCRGLQWRGGVGTKPFLLSGNKKNVKSVGLLPDTV